MCCAILAVMLTGLGNEHLVRTCLMRLCNSSHGLLIQHDQAHDCWALAAAATEEAECGLMLAALGQQRHKAQKNKSCNVQQTQIVKQ